MHRIGILILVAGAIVVVLGIVWTRRGKKPPAQKADVREFDPKSLLFSLPTICDEAPETIQNAGQASQSALQIDEDDWRQIEFIAVADLTQIDREMDDIETFKNANRAAIGWRNVYIRKERPNGLFPSQLPYSLIDSIPHGPIQELMIGTPGREAIVKGGFANASLPPHASDVLTTRSGNWWCGDFHPTSFTAFSAAPVKLGFLNN